MPTTMILFTGPPRYCGSFQVLVSSLVAQPHSVASNTVVTSGVRSVLMVIVTPVWVTAGLQEGKISAGPLRKGEKAGWNDNRVWGIIDGYISLLQSNPKWMRPQCKSPRRRRRVEAGADRRDPIEDSCPPGKCAAHETRSPADLPVVYRNHEAAGPTGGGQSCGLFCRQSL